LDINEGKYSWLVSIGQALAWLVTSLLAVISGLYIRDAALSIASLFQAAQYQAFRQKGGVGLDFSTGYLVGVFDNVLALILGIAAIMAVVGIEYYFRKGRPKGLLLKRIGIVLGVEIGIIIISILIRMVI
jgi:hypothetical protein